MLTNQCCIAKSFPWVKLKQSISFQLRCVCATGNDYLEKAAATSGLISVPCNLWHNPEYLSAVHTLFYWTTLIFWDIVTVGITFFGLLLFPGDAENIYSWNIEKKDSCCGFFLWLCCLQSGTWVHPLGFSLSLTISSTAGRRCGIIEMVMWWCRRLEAIFSWVWQNWGRVSSSLLCLTFLLWKWPKWQRMRWYFGEISEAYKSKTLLV